MHDMGRNHWIGLGVAVVLGAGSMAQTPATAPEKAAPATEAAAPAPEKAPVAKEKAPAPAAKGKGPFAGLMVAPKKPAPPRIVQQWKNIDADGNGQANYGDIQKVMPDFPAERFAVLDKNKDGVVSKDELPKTAPEAKRKSGDLRQSAQTLNGLLIQADADKDGKVSEAEFSKALPKAPEGRFKELDRNKDGALDKQDVPPAGGQGGMRAADTDGDNKVSKAEFELRFANLPKDRFEKLDKNGDGFLDEKDRAESKNLGLERSPSGWADAMKNIITHSDKDKDGKVSFEEYAKGKTDMPRSAFDAFDSNKDGFLTKEDTGPKAPAGSKEKRGGPISPQENRERFKRADKDGDGKLTLEEAKTEFPAITEERFNERDVNGDGKLGPDDRKAATGATAEPPAAE